MIAILAPYNRGEATSAAIRLANLVLAHGGEVRLVATTNAESGVHSYWDQRVWSGRGDGVYYAARNVAKFVHFQPHPALREMTELVAEQAEHILVPQWHQLKPEDGALLLDHHVIVCPSRRCREGIRDVVFNGIEPSKTVLTWANFDAGIPFVTREGLVAEGGNPRVLFLANHTVVDACGPMVLRLIAALLDELPKLTVSILCNKTWPEQDRKDIRKMRAHYGERFHSGKLSNANQLTKEIHAHDWVVLPWTRVDFGVTAMQALACGAPVIAWDIEPCSEIIVSEKNGLLIPCELQVSKFHAPTAVPDLGRTLKTLIPAFRDNRMLFRMQTQDWHLDQLEKEFNKFWARLLGLVESD